MKISFIGLGNMATAIIKGILGAGIVKAEDIVGVCKTDKTASEISKEYSIKTMTSISDEIFEADIIVLAVKPQVLAGVCEEIKEKIDPSKLIVSVAAGKTIKWLSDNLSEGLKIVRTMPNTPALVGEGCSAIAVSESVTAEETALVEKIFSSFGKAIVINEGLMDTVGAVSGSSPAFVFMFMEALADGAVKYGMPRKMAYEFAAQSVLGSAKLLLESGKHPGELKDMVCSPGGTTIEGVQALEENGLRAAVMAAVDAVMNKTKRL